MPVLEALPTLPPQGSVLPTEAHPQNSASTEAQLVPAVISTEASQREVERPLYFAPVTTPAEVRRAPKTQPKIPASELRAKDTHRLIASRYSDSGTVLSRLSADPDTLGKLLELDDATNDRFLGEAGLLPGIGIHELVYGVRYAHIVNAAFTHASPTGGRFNSPIRGAWYASLDRDTSVAEVAFHKLRHLAEIDWPHEEISTSDDYLADITSPFHDLRPPAATNPGAPPSPAVSSSAKVGSSGEPSGQPAGAPSSPTASPSERVGSATDLPGTPQSIDAAPPISLRPLSPPRPHPPLLHPPPAPRRPPPQP